MITVALVNIHGLLRDALRVLLETQQDLQVVGDVVGESDAGASFGQIQPDVAVVDASTLSDGAALFTRNILERHAHCTVLVLYGCNDQYTVKAMMQAGAAGVVAKMEGASGLLRAIRSVAHGERFPPAKPIQAMELERHPNDFSMLIREKKESLGRREREVLCLLAEGNSSPKIAVKLNIASSTVDVHRRNLMRKLNVHSVVELTRFAIREGMVAL